MSLVVAVVVGMLAGCGGGATGSMMVKIVSPANGATASGNQIIAATLLNPAVATAVDFKVNGTTFDTVTPALAMTARLDTLSRNLPNGPATITVQTTGNVYQASETININNPRSIYVVGVTGNSGSFVTVHVRLNDFATASSYHVFLNFNSAKLLLDTSSVQKGSGVPVASGFVANTGTPGILEATVTGSTAFSSGDLLTANFQIRSFSPSGTKNDIAVPLPALTSTTGASLSVVGVTGSVITD
jgi:hypothetical protein